MQGTVMTFGAIASIRFPKRIEAWLVSLMGGEDLGCLFGIIFESESLKQC
jgi:hypothetical protein